MSQSTILKLIDRDLIRKQVNRHQSDKHSKSNDSWMHLIPAKATSLHDIPTDYEVPQVT